MPLSAPIGNSEAMQPSTDDIAAVILALCHERGSGKTICPSEAARRLAPDGGWRALMDNVRAVAAALAERGEIEISQRGKRVTGRIPRGPIRLGRRED